MLPPILEIYVLWHPDDLKGVALGDRILEHFHGTAFSGLIGGAIEVYVRHARWSDSSAAPRPIPFIGGKYAGRIEPPEFIVVVPLMGIALASALEGGDDDWSSYLQEIVAEQTRHPASVGIFPYQLDRGLLDGTMLGDRLRRYQTLAANVPAASGEQIEDVLCRDLAQGIAQLIDPFHQRLKVFISHTKRSRPGDEEGTNSLVKLVRSVIAETRLQEFFDANDLQPGADWDEDLRQHASSAALLAVRTDLYPSREWCQREVRISKQSGMPIVILDAPGLGEERGSFLMDHVPRIPLRHIEGRWARTDVCRGLNYLVDECLKRALWKRQQNIATQRQIEEVSWWAPHAPEPTTLISWLAEQRQAAAWPPAQDELIILHPDPPLGADERLIVEQIIMFAGFTGRVSIMTPRMFAARGG